jgi:hypothetical protein
MSTRLFRILSIVITSIVLVSIPQASFATGRSGGGGGGFHGGGGGGGFHGGGGGFGGGFHGGMGGFHGGSGGWHGAGAVGGWHGSPGWNGWGHTGWGPGWGGWGRPGWGWGGGWGFGVGINIGWGWGWPAYPYAYGYPYYYPYYPNYPPYYGPYNYPPTPPPANPGDRGNSGDPRGNAWQQNSDAPAPALSPNNNVVTIKAPKVPPRYTNYRTVAAVDAAQRPEVRNVLRALQAMPPEARQRQIESGRYRNLAPEEQALIRRVALTSSVVGTR